MINKPINIDKLTWFYERRQGLDFVREVRSTNDEYLQTEQFTVPWKLIRISLARKDKKHLPRAPKSRKRDGKR
jgi:hypothetical protein